MLNVPPSNEQSDPTYPLSCFSIFYLRKKISKKGNILNMRVLKWVRWDARPWIPFSWIAPHNGLRKFSYFLHIFCIEKSTFIMRFDSIKVFWAITSTVYRVLFNICHLRSSNKSSFSPIDWRNFQQLNQSRAKTINCQ